PARRDAPGGARALPLPGDRRLVRDGRVRRPRRPDLRGAVARRRGGAVALGTDRMTVVRRHGAADGWGERAVALSAGPEPVRAPPRRPSSPSPLRGRRTRRAPRPAPPRAPSRR